MVMLIKWKKSIFVCYIFGVWIKKEMLYVYVYFFFFVLDEKNNNKINNKNNMLISNEMEIEW